MRKAAKLMKLAGNNPDANEAMSALQKAQGIMDEFQIEQNMLSLDGEEKPKEDIIDFGDKPEGWLDQSGRLASWKVRLAVFLGKYNQCLVYTMQDKINIVGRPSDVGTVRYLYAMMCVEIDSLTKLHGKGLGHVWCNSFRIGVVEGMGEKMEMARKEMADRMRADAQAAAGNALIRVNNALLKMEQDRKEVVAYAYKKHNFVKRGGGGFQNNQTARDFGRQVGREHGGVRPAGGMKRLK